MEGRWCGGWWIVCGRESEKRDAASGFGLRASVPGSDVRSGPKPEAECRKPDAASPTCWITRELLPNPQGGRVCCEDGSDGFNAGQREPGELCVCGECAHPASGGCGDFLPGDLQADGVAEATSEVALGDSDDAREFRSR